MHEGIGGCDVNEPKVVELAARQTGKRKANNYYIKISPTYMAKILKGFRGKGSAEFFRQHTDELWDPHFSRLSAAEYGAFRRILSMFARSKKSLKENMIVVTAKELKMHGITLRVLKQLCANATHLKISLLTESGEIIDLDGS